MSNKNKYMKKLVLFLLLMININFIHSAARSMLPSTYSYCLDYYPELWNIIKPLNYTNLVNFWVDYYISSSFDLDEFILLTQSIHLSKKEWKDTFNIDVAKCGGVLLNTPTLTKTKNPVQYDFSDCEHIDECMMPSEYYEVLLLMKKWENNFYDVVTNVERERFGDEILDERMNLIWAHLYAFPKDIEDYKVALKCIGFGIAPGRRLFPAMVTVVKKEGEEPKFYFSANYYDPRRFQYQNLIGYEIYLFKEDILSFITNMSGINFTELGINDYNSLYSHIVKRLPESFYCVKGKYFITGFDIDSRGTITKLYVYGKDLDGNVKEITLNIPASDRFSPFPTGSIVFEGAENPYEGSVFCNEEDSLLAIGFETRWKMENGILTPHFYYDVLCSQGIDFWENLRKDCLGDGDCNEDKPYCIEELDYKCAECRENSNCLNKYGAQKQYCDNYRCVQCINDNHCGGSTPYCVNNQCVECRNNNDCGEDENCVNNQCIKG